MTAGGEKTKTIALRNWENLIIARWAMGPTFWCASGRRSQSLSLAKAMPTFCPAPAMPMPETVKTASTESGSFCSKCCWRSWRAPLVCSRVALGGSITIESSMP